MMRFSLSTTERRQLNDLLHTTGSSKIYRRAQALLWLDEGWKLRAVAEHLHVSRYTVANWRDQYLVRHEFPLLERLADAPRSGRPPKVEGHIDFLLTEVIDTDPRDFGYQSTTWTASLLVQYLDDWHHMEVVPRTVSRVLERSRVSWKRPRHDLASRSPTWRQAKGG